MSDGPAIEYCGMGPWPMYLGFTTSEDDFGKEMERLCVSNPPPFLGSDHAHATLHTFDAPSFSGLTCIITMEKQPRKKAVEQIAGLLAHEATHVAQLLWEYIGEDRPGKEAEAYLVQSVTQFCMQQLLDTGRVRKEAP